jgi:SAM-dependent methyltransferase
MTSAYAARAPHYAAEIRAAPQPDALAGLLRPGLRVAEMPSGTGHFLPAYQAAGANVDLIDACRPMLHAARRQAARLAIQPRLLCSPIEDLTPQAGPFDLIVMPNGALNLLAARTPAAELLTAAARPLVPGGLLLAQTLDPVGDTACGFYDPHLDDGAWHIDRQFGHVFSRRRRQHHDCPDIRIDFELRGGVGLIYRQRLTLRLLGIGDIRSALATAGLTDVTIHAGAGGLTEVLAGRSAWVTA